MLCIYEKVSKHGRLIGDDGLSELPNFSKRVEKNQVESQIGQHREDSAG